MRRELRKVIQRDLPNPFLKLIPKEDCFFGEPVKVPLIWGGEEK